MLPLTERPHSLACFLSAALVTLSSLPLAGAVAPAPPGPFGLPALSHGDFNRLAVQASVPLYWAVDTENPGVLDPRELTSLDGKRSTWVTGDSFTPELEMVYRSLVERRRQEALARELDQGRITLLESDFAGLTAQDRAVMRNLEVAARAIDELYKEQLGVAGLKARIAFDDTAARAVFDRNQGPECSAPQTAGDPFCNALPDFFEPRSGLYPQDIVPDEAFCKALGNKKNAKALLDPFTVVRRDRGGRLVAVPYTEAYAKGMGRVARALKAAAGALNDPKEKAFHTYLLAAAEGFETNRWWDADEAWSRMNASNSRWYLRIAPDETYFDPCGIKAGFHLSLARVNQQANSWAERLTKLRGDMERAVADRIGEPYTAREVKFHLPEFIDIVLNAGDSRSPLGGTLGQSLPNFGPVARESRGRTVAMANLYTDPVSNDVARKRAHSLLTLGAMKLWSEDPAARNLDTVLHEAMHNFGPTGSFRVGGKLPEEIFGGPTDAILEELKAQTGSLFFAAFLKTQGLLTEKQVHEVYASTVTWAFGHIAHGLWKPNGKPKTYSQISAILVHTFFEAGALEFVDNGKGEADAGRYHIVPEKIGPAIDALMHRVGQIKATGNASDAKALIDPAVSPQALRAMRADIITERVLRYPKASFVYKVRYGHE